MFPNRTLDGAIFHGKKVLILSSDRWRKMRVSKHHYALELARCGADVFFHNPSEIIAGHDQIHKQPVGDTCINVIDFNTNFRGKTRLPLKLRRVTDHFFAKRLEYLCGTRFDIVWSFWDGEFASLSAFDCRLKIYHPVDKTRYRTAQVMASTADMICSVATAILSDFSNCRALKLFVNHGISNEISKLAAIELARLESNTETTQRSSGLRVTYAGNLLRPDIDHALLRSIINRHPEIEFVFAGAYSGLHLAGSPPQPQIALDFIKWLKAKQNVTLVGVLDQIELYELFQSSDLLIHCYNPLMDINACSNSHKLLEYLASGKTILAPFISELERNADLLCMAEHWQLNEMFDEIIMRIGESNANEKCIRRIKFALSNTYEAHLRRIESFIHLNGLYRS
jgi:hypothetical protein